MMKKAISTLTFAASLAAGMMVLPIAGDALAKSGVSEDEFDRKIDAEFHVSDHRAWIREARQLLEKNAGASTRKTRAGTRKTAQASKGKRKRTSTNTKRGKKRRKTEIKRRTSTK